MESLAIGVVGMAVVVLMGSDIFQSVIVPRPTNAWRPSALIARNGWRFATAVGTRLLDADRREALYGIYAPMLLVGLLAFWVAGLTLGFGLTFFALRSELRPEPQSYWASVYYAGSSLLTLGYGDIVAQRGAARAVSLAAAWVGLATFAIVTAFLFLLFGAFQRRETFILTLRERIGAPPSGVDLIERLAKLDMLDDLGPIFGRAEEWMADLMESHLAYPVLSYFRSAHDNQSWVGTIGALLDASTLVITTVDAGNVGQAKMLSGIGRHLVGDYVQYYRLFSRRDLQLEVGIERAEFDGAYDRLAQRGLSLHERDAAWAAFASIRASYAVPLNAMAQYFRIPPALWIGDRSLIATRHAPVPVVRAGG
jgi:hypothetical protein